MCRWCLFYKERSFVKGPLIKNITALLVIQSVLYGRGVQDRGSGFSFHQADRELGPKSTQSARTAVLTGGHDV